MRQRGRRRSSAWSGPLTMSPLRRWALRSFVALGIAYAAGFTRHLSLGLYLAVLFAVLADGARTIAAARRKAGRDTVPPRQS